jgi:hypothetical protein
VKLADRGSSLCWQPSAVFPLLGRCLEEPQHERGDKLRIIRNRDVAQAGEPLQLGVADEGEEPRALHGDQRVGGPLHEKDRAGDVLKPRRDIEHGRLDRVQIPRGVGEVQQQLTGVLGGQLPGSAPLHGEEQRPSGCCGSQLGCVGGEQPGQGSSAQQCRRLVESLQWRAQPVGSDGDDRMGTAPGGELEGDSGAEGVPGDVELGNAEPVQLAFNGIRQDRRGGRNPRGERGGASEAGEVHRDDVVVVAQCLVDRLPADSGFSHPVEQDEWLACSGSVMGEIVGGGRRQAGHDDVSLLGGQLKHAGQVAGFAGLVAMEQVVSGSLGGVRGSDRWLPVRCRRVDRVGGGLPGAGADGTARLAADAGAPDQATVPLAVIVSGAGSIQVPIENAAILDAPSVAVGEEISEATAIALRRYYGLDDPVAPAEGDHGPSGTESLDAGAAAPLRRRRRR